MENLGGWSELPFDLLGSIFERLSLAEFHRVKLVCWNWNSCSKLAVAPQSTSPWLILFPYENDSCMLYSPDEDRIYKTTKRCFSGSQLLSSSGKWFLVQDSQSYLYIIDVFSDKEIKLPPLESIKSRTYSLKRVDQRTFRREFRRCKVSPDLSGDDLMGRLWVDEKTEEYVVVWCFDGKYLGFCKKGDDYYTNIKLKLASGIPDMVLRGYRLYILTTTHVHVRILDLCSEEGFEDVTGANPLSMSIIGYINYEGYRVTMTITKSGEVLVAPSIRRCCRVYKKNPNANPNGDYFTCINYKVDSLGDEAMISDLGITAVHGVEPNSIYLARYYERPSRSEGFQINVDISVFNPATETFKTFPSLSKYHLEDARWFLPST